MTNYYAAVLMCALDCFDGLAGAVPSSSGAPKLPGNMVFPESFQIKNKGLGLKTEENDDYVMRGTADISVSFYFWDSDAKIASDRARVLISLMLNTKSSKSSTVTNDGASIDLTVSDVTFNGTSGPEYLGDLQAWKLSVSGSFELDYEVRVHRDGGVIDRVDVILPDVEIESFEVT